MASLDEQIAEIDRLLGDKVPSALVKAYAEDISDKTVVLVLSDWLLERGVEPQPVIERMKLLNEQRIRRENMAEVLHEQGNLEEEPLRIQALTMDPDPVFVPVEFQAARQSWRVTVEADHTHPPRIYDVTVLQKSLIPDALPRWRHVELRPPGLPDELERAGITAADVIRQAEEKLDRPWVGRDGEMFYVQGQPSNEWLWMGYPPEHMQRQLERQFPDSDFITLYTDGGGYQSAADPAFVVDGKQLYQLVHDSTFNPETECPFKDWSIENREDERDRHVTEADTLWGEYPHKSCRFCEAKIGEAHGYLYVGEGGEYVYASVPEEDEEDEGEPGA